MKRLILVAVLIHTFSAQADMEHKSGLGTMPAKQSLTSSRACFQEIDNKGCGHPRDDQEFFIACLDENKNSLTQSCRSFFDTLYGKKKSI